MKRINLIIGIVALSLVFTSCKSEGSENANTDSNGETATDITSIENLGDFIDFDLRPYELNASILVPKNERATIHHQLDTYVWDLKMGKQTYVTIKDWGTLNGFEKYLEEIENLPETIEFIEKGNNFTLYTLTTGTSKVTYHTAAQHEIDGINYLFESSSNGLSKDGVEHAVISVKSVKEVK